MSGEKRSYYDGSNEEPIFKNANSILFKFTYYFVYI